MIPKPKHDIYIKAGDDHYVKIAWFHEFKDYELMIGFYGLDGGDPSLAYQYTDREVTAEEKMSLKIPHKEAIYKGNLPTCHLTFHKDNKSQPGNFHMRNKKGNPSNIVSLIGNIDRNSGVILDFFIISDLISRYKKSETYPDSTDIVFEINDDHKNTIAAIRGRYSGIDFEMEEVLREDARTFGLASISSIAYIDRMLKGYFTIDYASLNQEAIKNKNVGTYFSISFPIGGDKHLIRTYIFS